MAHIEILWLSEDHDCETCGPSFADGASVNIDGKEAILLSPIANCCGGVRYEPDEVLLKILLHLGHTVRSLR